MLFSPNHVQPLNVKFKLVFNKKGGFQVSAESDKVNLYNYASEEYVGKKVDWSFYKYGKSGQLVETSDLAFIIQVDSNRLVNEEDLSAYSFEFKLSLIHI